MTSQFRHVVCDVRARYALQCPLLKGLKFSSIFLHRVLCSIGILATDRDAKLRPTFASRGLLRIECRLGIWKHRDFRLISCFISETIQDMAKYGTRIRTRKRSNVTMYWLRWGPIMSKTLQGHRTKLNKPKKRQKKRQQSVVAGRRQL